MKRYTTVALAALLLASLAGSSARAQCKPYGAKIALEATKEGESLSFIGTTTLQIRSDCWELFGLTVSGKIADGEMLTVLAVSKAGSFQIGGIEMFDNVGQLVLNNIQDVSDVFPLSQLVSLQVIQAPTTIKTRKIPARLQAPVILLEVAF